ncbi:MAG: M20 family metallo-hydrolase [Spirochaetales bacterium]|nr:M20 family metallo-hydrolase [Spirochaetales bacterium]
MQNSKDFLNSQVENIVELETMLTSHIAIAPEGNGNGEVEKCNALEQWLRKNGFENIERFEAPDNRVSDGIRPSLVVTIPGASDEYRTWVMAHLDVVPTGDLSLWKSDPWKVQRDGDILIGRGVEDNQQGLCSSVFAALYYLKNGITPGHTIKLLFVADEENGSEYGIIWLLKNKNLFRKEDIILIPDGGDSEGRTIEIAEKNILWLSVHVIGKQTHGSRPDSGANACLAASDLSVRLHKLEKIFNKKDELFEPDYSTFQPTKRAKNVDSINIIPGEDWFCMDCRILPCYPLKDVIAEIDKNCCNIENEYGVKVEYTTPQKSESPATPVNAPVAQKLAAAIKQVHGIEAKFIGIGGGTVGAELRREGYNAVVWSTLDDMAHQPNEYCKISNLIKDSQTLVELFKD